MQFVINTNMLRELDERKLINAYARLVYLEEKDVSDDITIKENIENLLDWDRSGKLGIGLYCGRFESIKKGDWEKLIKFIKDNSYEIKIISRPYVKKKLIKHDKEINNYLELKEQHNKERFTDVDYTVSGRGKKARPCIYEGREYKSRQECMYKEGLTKYQIWKYLKDTNQI